MATLKLYLDACALNRLTDDQRQPRIRREAEAVEEIFHLIEVGKAVWVSGDAVELEIRRNPDVQRRQDVLGLLPIATERVAITAPVRERAITLENAGYGAFDALHVASAEQAGADVLITTDDRFLKQARRGLGEPRVQVQNPLDWLQEASL